MSKRAAEQFTDATTFGAAKFGAVVATLDSAVVATFCSTVDAAECDSLAPAQLQAVVAAIHISDRAALGAALSEALGATVGEPHLAAVLPADNEPHLSTDRAAQWTAFRTTLVSPQLPTLAAAHRTTEWPALYPAVWKPHFSANTRAEFTAFCESVESTECSACFKTVWSAVGAAQQSSQSPTYLSAQRCSQCPTVLPAVAATLLTAVCVAH